VVRRHPIGRVVDVEEFAPVLEELQGLQRNLVFDFFPVLGVGVEDEGIGPLISFVLSPIPDVQARRLHTTAPEPTRVSAASLDASLW
jgi:hypothetical protein